MIRVVFAEDQELFREGVTGLIEAGREPKIRVVASTRTSDDVLDLLAKHAADVLLLDIRMKGMSVFDLMPLVRRAHPTVRILMLTMYDEALLGERAVEAGASGYLTKGRTAEDLILAIQTVAAGQEFLGSDTKHRRDARKSGRRPRRSERTPYERLSDREREVMRMIGEGKGTSEIAEWMGRSPKTVSTFRKRLLQKMDFKGDADVVRFFEDQKPGVGTQEL